MGDFGPKSWVGFGQTRARWGAPDPALGPERARAVGPGGKTDRPKQRGTSPVTLRWNVPGQPAAATSLPDEAVSQPAWGSPNFESR